MKSILVLCAIFLSGVFLFATQIFAHGGVEKSVGDVTVYLTQSPVAPLVGEPVTMTFVLKNSTSLRVLPFFTGTIKLIDTHSGDPTKDKIVLEKPFQTDVNGAWTFSYTFDKENYFDVELFFPDSRGKSVSTGFLVQPRTSTTVVQSNLPLIPYLAMMFVAGALTVGVALAKLL